MEKTLDCLIDSCPFPAYVKCQLMQNERSEEEDTAVKSNSKEQLLKLQVNLPELWKESIKVDATYLIVAVDTSGSMSGSPITQVKTALHELLSQTTLCSYIKTDVMAYNNNVSILDIGKDSAMNRAIVEKLTASGTTNFAVVFENINKLLSKSATSFERAVIVFMTDGQDTVNRAEDLAGATSSWKGGLKTHGIPVTVHSVGFSQGHNYDFLSGLIKAGDGNGMYRYCEQNDGPNILMEKLQELFDFILQGSGNTVDIQLSINDENKIDDNGKEAQDCLMKATIDTGSSVVNTETWILNQNPSVCPVVKIQLKKKFKQNTTVSEMTFPCDVCSCEAEVMTSIKDKCFWNLKLLSRNADHLARKLAEVITNKGDASVIDKRIKKLQDRLSRIPLYGKDIDIDLREEIRKLMSDIQEKINKIYSLVADYARKETVSVGMLARAHDMRYQAEFAKSRRQRLMDRRVAKNLTEAKTAQDKLTALNVDKEEIENIQEATCEFYFCALSQNSVKDILHDNECDDLIGFGLAVKRTEVVMDEPSLIWIHNISGTVVSRSAMLDALEFKLKIDGQLQAHGGFNFDLGVTTVGLGREPINAWLPLYVNRQHWEKVKILLKSVLGYFCTLDPLGYDYKQIDIMFMTLGSMVSQLSNTQLGEHQIKMIMAFQRTCQACIIDFDLVSQVTTILTNFITSPAGRTKDIVPNLLTLVGYLISLPKDKVKTVLESNDKTVDFNVKRFWMAFVAEELRRSGGNLYKDTTNGVIYGNIDALLNAKDDDESISCQDPLMTLKKLSKEAFDKHSEKLVPKEFDAKSGLPSQTAAPTHSVKVDQAMEIWAQSKCGVIRNKNQAEKVSNATKIVNEWIKEGQKLCVVSVNTDCLDDDEKKDSKADHVTLSMLKLLVQIIKTLMQSSYPSLSCIPGCIGYMNFCLGEYDVCDIDQNGGLPPASWIDAVKKSVMDVYESIKDNDSEDSVDDTVVVMATPDELHSQQTVTADTNVDSNVTMETGKDKPDLTTDDDNNDDSEPVCDHDSYDDNDYDDHDDDDDNDDNDNEELGYVDSSIHDKPVHKSGHIHLFSILQLLNGDLNVIQTYRVLACQILLCPSNSKARAAIHNGEFLDLSLTDNAELDKEISRMKALLQIKVQNAIKDYMEEIIWKRANHCMLMTDSVWAFIGYLLNTYSERNEGVRWMVSAMMDEDAMPIPLLADKVRILFRGKYEDHAVIAKGNVYLPEKKTSLAFTKVLGEEVWNDIEIDLRSHISLHVYRISDIPNRHGHCNSNPYICNALRTKLGMPLLKEKYSGTRKRRIRSGKT